MDANLDNIKLTNHKFKATKTFKPMPMKKRKLHSLTGRLNIEHQTPDIDRNNVIFKNH
jgi:hypothetical protein